jgi:hypothetical protein
MHVVTFRRLLAVVFALFAGTVGALAGPAPQAAAACNYCIVIANQPTAGSPQLTVSLDSAETCGSSPQASLPNGEDTRYYLGWADAGCAYVSEGYDLLISHEGSSGWVCRKSTGWVRFAEPSSPDSAYWIYVYKMRESRNCDGLG